MKVAILSVADRRHMTPSSSYEDYFTKNGIPYDVICGNKYDDNKGDENHFYYCWDKNGNQSKVFKLGQYLKFREFAIRIIKEKRYDFIVVWNENTAALFSTFLVKRYRDRYCINIRDTVADIGFLQKFAWLAINNAVFCTRPWVRDIEEYPKETYSILNYDKKILDRCTIKQGIKQRGEQIVITYMGLARSGLNTHYRFIDAFANDERFLLKYYGTDCDTLINDYVKQKNIKNCICSGTFPPERTASLLEECDVIMNYYNTGGSQLKVTVGVKASYGPFLRIPQIVDDDTYWAEVCTKYGFGFPVKNENSLANDFYEWYYNIDFAKFDEGCRDYITFVNETNRAFYSKCNMVFGIKD